MATITINSPEIGQPELSLIPLWSHQKKMVYRCLQIETMFNQLEQQRKGQRNPMAEDIPETFGIMADKPGTGKTFVAVSLILSDLKNSKNQCNLIVVPQNIYTQWITSIERFSSKLTFVKFVEYENIMSLYIKPDILKNNDNPILSTFSIILHSLLE